MAVADYGYLLQKNYSLSAILKLVGDRYQLPGEERSMLMRGISRPEDCNTRKQKTIPEIPEGSDLYLDGYNVLRTLGSYFLGKILFVSLDGFLRDASEMHRKTLPTMIRKKCIREIFSYLSERRPGAIRIYLDEPVSKSGELASEMNDWITNHGMEGHALTMHSPDHQLKSVGHGIVCSADSSIIDHCQTNVFDLPRAILETRYQPRLIRLDKLFED
ncbi:MAG: DUF434 domain-containing protein [bacterium]